MFNIHPNILLLHIRSFIQININQRFNERIDSRLTLRSIQNDINIKILNNIQIEKINKIEI